MSDLVGNPEERFSHNEAQILVNRYGGIRGGLKSHVKVLYLIESQCTHTIHFMAKYMLILSDIQLFE